MRQSKQFFFSSGVYVYHDVDTLCFYYVSARTICSNVFGEKV